MRYLFPHLTLIILSLCSCDNKVEPKTWNSKEEHTYFSLDSSDHSFLTLPSESIPNDGIIYFNILNKYYASPKELSYVDFKEMISDFQIVSNFILVSANFDLFLSSGVLSIDYQHDFVIDAGSFTHQYYFHNDLYLYRVPHFDDVPGSIQNMALWSPHPFQFQDTLDSGYGTITANITDANAIYVVARKIE